MLRYFIYGNATAQTVSLIMTAQQQVAYSAACGLLDFQI
jgi:hypothetical protein